MKTADLPDTTRPTRRAAEPHTEDVAFTRGPARRPVTTVADPLLQWSTGLPTKERTIYAGWLIEARRDEALDQAMDAAGFSLVTIKHGSGNLVTHWAVETATVFVVADGVQSIGEMKRTNERFGIAFGWRTLSGGKQQSQLRCRVLLRELLAVGYEQPLLLTVKGTLTGDLLQAFMRQYDVLDANAELRKQAKKEPWDLPLYAFSIPLGAGAEVTRGTGGTTKEITPMVAAIPERITKEYLKAHWIGRAWVATIEALVESAIAWSVSESALIAAGEDDRQPWEGARYDGREDPL